MFKGIDLQNKPVYTTGVAATITEISPKTLINYEAARIFTVKRNKSGRRLFSQQDLLTAMLVRHLLTEKNLNFEGAKFVLQLIQKSAKKDIDLLPMIVSKKAIQSFRKKLV